MSTNTYTTFETHLFESDEFKDAITSIIEREDSIPFVLEKGISSWNKGMSGEEFAHFRGKKHTEETKEKMRKADKSYMNSDAYRQKMSESIKKWHETKRNTP